MNKQLQKAIDLAAYTGDKIIVVDENNDRSTVLMSLDEYEKMLFGENKTKNPDNDLTDNNWLDKINREITLGDSVNIDEVESEEEARIEDDFLPSENNFSDTVSNPIDEVNIEESIPDIELEKKDVMPDVDASEINDEPEGEENLYYYEEAPEVPAVEASEAATKEGDSFTSVGDELKNRHNWEIPKNIKSGAQEVK